MTVNADWRMDKQLVQLGLGKTTTQRVKAYVAMWESRCYSDGIPEEIPPLLSKTGRAPSWKDIALCILKNDLLLKGIGFSSDNYNKKLVNALRDMNSDKPKQEEMRL